MFGIGSTEILVILLVALIVLGPSKLPDVAKSIGKALGEFRRVTTDVKRTIEMEAEAAEQKAKAEAARKELFGDGKAPQQGAPEAEASAPVATAAPATPEAVAPATAASTTEEKTA
ncbi:MAG: preprotein translocase subunit TatA [Desulfomicrobiaceae bacterium]|jgi:sec-independent protein translocase protein TatB|nr:twin-arginine translocase subunit TatB [Desulfomicrobiaceae bacterium]MBZ4648626.1 preprotein translocase subunit TatA [Desulfomicrobiaceae bacterium]MBZ4685466.1 preprotein translocase subunit TatA [Desulfomicrobiaceae bacterium]